VTATSFNFDLYSPRTNPLLSLRTSLGLTA
jgi:hypothetical protein